MNLLLLIAMAASATILQEENPLLIRISNKSAYDLENIEINSPASGLIHFGKLKSGEKSDYRKFEKAYPIPAVAAEIENKKIEFLPDDYLGEQLLKPGKYTYELSIIEKDGVKYLRLNFIVEEKF
jgi:hypothetical protein